MAVVSDLRRSSANLSTARLARWTTVIVIVVAAVAALIGAVGATHLRPANDDYWHAVNAQHGLIGSIHEWWLTVSGDVVTMASNTLLNGLPLLHMPWPLTSALPFLVTFIVIGGVGLVLLGSMRTWRARGLLTTLAAWLVLSFMWWAFLWMPLTDDASPRRQIALGLTHWQNLNTAYVIPPALLLAGWVALCRSSLGQRGRLVGGLVLGLAAGMSGPVIGATAVAWLATAGLILAVAAAPVRRTLVVQAVAVGSGAVVGLAVAYLSPGSQARKTMISPTFELSLDGVRGLTAAFPQAAGDLASTFMHPGSVVVIAVVSGLVAVAAAGGKQPPSATPFAGAAGLLLSFAAMYAVVNRLSEFFVGHGFWHVAAVQALGYLTLVLTGVFLGLRLNTVDSVRITVAAAVVAVLGSLVGLGAVEIATHSMAARQAQWDVGPAPIEGVFEDIENPDRWQMRFWRELTTLRDTPNRG